MRPATAQPGSLSDLLDLDVISKVLRDILTEDVRRIVVDSKREYGKIVQFIETFMPNLEYSIELYQDQEPVFDALGLEVEIAAPWAPGCGSRAVATLSSNRPKP
ncbi:MAG: ribonuclease E/G [Syntrophotaleaceae bacterium]